MNISIRGVERLGNTYFARREERAQVGATICAGDKPDEVPRFAPVNTLQRRDYRQTVISQVLRLRAVLGAHLGVQHVQVQRRSR